MSNTLKCSIILMSALTLNACVSKKSGSKVAGLNSSALKLEDCIVKATPSPVVVASPSPSPSPSPEEVEPISVDNFIPGNNGNVVNNISFGLANTATPEPVSYDQVCLQKYIEQQKNLNLPTPTPTPEVKQATSQIAEGCEPVRILTADQIASAIGQNNRSFYASVCDAQISQLRYLVDEYKFCQSGFWNKESNLDRMKRLTKEFKAQSLNSARQFAKQASDMNFCANLSTASQVQADTKRLGIQAAYKYFSTDLYSALSQAAGGL